MFKNFWKTAWRNLWKNKLYALINITGLSVGIVCCVFIFSYVQYEQGYDKFNLKAGDIYRLTEVLHLPRETNARALTSPPMAPLVKARFPEVKEAVRLSFSGRHISCNDKKIQDAKIMYADSGFFNVFTFQVREGNLQGTLNKPYSIVLTQTLAEKYFQKGAAVGKTVYLSDTIPLMVTAVIQDVPANAHFSFDCILSRSTISAINNYQPETQWFNNNYYTYLLLEKNSSYHQLEGKINAYIRDQMKDEIKATGLYYDMKLQPLTSIHLHSHLSSEIQPNSDVIYNYIFSVAALLIMFIACINFINLSTARSVYRAKEIGLRKAIGATRKQLVFQFFGESFFYTLLSTVISVIAVVILIPWFKLFTGEQLTIAGFFSGGMLLLYAGIIVIVSITAGVYPAFLLSSFSPVKAFKGTTQYHWRDIFLRKGLVVFQFTISIILISGSLLVFQQLKFIQDQKLGLNKEQLIEVKLTAAQSIKKDLLLQAFAKNSYISKASSTSFSFKEPVSTIATLPEGFSSDEVNSIASIFGDENFLKTFQIPLVAGRNFSRSYPTDVTEAFIVNETAVKTFNWKSNRDAIGKTIDWGLGKKGKVIGVVKDFNFSSLHENIKAVTIQIFPEEQNFIALQVKPGKMQEALTTLAISWKKIVADDDVFNYSFLDEDFAALYKSEQNLQRILWVFTVISILIACLGLFGLAAFSITQRVKEIGIRKVVGAGVMSILGLLSKDFLKLAMIAICIASPLAWLIVSKWLQNFAYHIHISWFTFVFVGVIVMLIAIITVGAQAAKAALANPVKSLRTE